MTFMAEPRVCLEGRWPARVRRHNSRLINLHTTVFESYPWSISLSIFHIVVTIVIHVNLWVLIWAKTATERGEIILRSRYSGEFWWCDRVYRLYLEMRDNFQKCRTFHILGSSNKAESTRMAFCATSPKSQAEASWHDVALSLESAEPVHILRSISL